MDDSPNVSRHYIFSPPIDLPAILETLQIQYLDVNETRALVIFNTAILNLESVEGEFTDLTSADITVYELPRDTTTDGTNQESISLIESFINQITSNGKTTASR